MPSSSLTITTRMAIAIGIILPLAETIRRANQILDLTCFMCWFDDYLLGGFLVITAWRVMLQKKNSLPRLIAAWGVGVGALFLSFVGQFDYYKTATGDPGLFDTTFVAVIKGLILLYMVVGLWFSLKASRTD